MKKPFVAIVDDDSGSSAYLRTFLSLRGVRGAVLHARRRVARGHEADEAPDVVLLDVMMPGLDGLATLRALKAAARGAGHHAVGPQPGLHHRRGRAPRRGRLRGQARRPRGARGDRAGRRDQERHREEPPRVGADGAAPAAERRRGPVGLGQQREDARHRHGDRTGGRQRRHRAHPRRERRRQGTGLAGDPPALDAAQPARSSRSTARRCRPSCSRASCSATSGGVHRRRDDAHRQVRAGRHGHA
jgi:hypothetical protein